MKLRTARTGYGSRVRELRGMDRSRAAFGDVLCRSDRHVERLEKETIELREDEAVWIAHKTRADVHWLMTGKGKRSGPMQAGLVDAPAETFHDTPTVALPVLPLATFDDSNATSYVHIDSRVLFAHGLSKDDSAAVYMEGVMMGSTMPAGSLLLVERQRSAQIVDSAVYVVRIGPATTVVRLVEDDGVLLARSDVDRSHMIVDPEHHTVLGRVVASLNWH